MLDSLVRVSRRVGWKADKFATDPQRKAPAGPTSRGRAVGGHGCPVPTSRTPPEGRAATKADAVVPRSQSGWPHGAITARARGSRLPSPRASNRLETGRGALPVESAHGGARRSAADGSRGSRTAAPRAARRAEFHGPTLPIHPFTSERFHVLLNSLFKVLFNFPSRYLSAIGLVPVFSLRWSLPPSLGCIPKQPDSRDARSRAAQRQ